MLSEEMALLFSEARDEIIEIELLTPQDNSIGQLGKKISGKLTYNLDREIRGGGDMIVRLSSDVNWLASRVKISRGLRVGGEKLLWGCGVYLPSVGDETWSRTGAQVQVSLLDKTVILKNRVTTDTLAFAPGDNAVARVKERITLAGEAKVSIPDSALTLRSPMSWPPNTTFLKIVNDTLAAINYFSISADGDGWLRSGPYRSPAERPVAFHFRNDKRGIVSPEFTLLKKLTEVPNMLTGFARVDGNDAILSSVATNTNPNSIFSYQGRGNTWHPQTIDNLEASDQATLDALVQRALIERTSQARGVRFRHGWLPLTGNDVVGWTNTRANVDMFATVNEWSMDLEETSLMETMVTEVITL